MISNGEKVKYEIDMAMWVKEEQCFDVDQEKSYRNLTGVEAMRIIAQFLAEHPNAEDNDFINHSVHDQMVVSLIDYADNGNFYNLDCSIQKEYPKW